MFTRRKETMSEMLVADKVSKVKMDIKQSRFDCVEDDEGVYSSIHESKCTSENLILSIASLPNAIAKANPPWGN